MEDLVFKKNIFLEIQSMKSLNNYKTSDSSCRSRHQNVMVKSFEKYKKTCDDLALIDKAVLKKKFRLSLHEPIDVANLKIEKDNTFKLNIKEKLNTSAKKHYSTKENTNKYVDTINMNDIKEKETASNEIIEIKCTQKLSDNNNESGMSKWDGEMLIKHEHELKEKSENAVTFTDDLKSDLQSLLIMMAMSSTCNEKESGKSDIVIHNDCPNCEGHVENEKVKRLSVEQMHDKKNISNLLKIEALKPTAILDENGFIKKYVNKWLSYVNKRKENNIHCQRLATINNFFDRLKKRKNSMNHTAEPSNKARLQACDYNTYQHRYKVQKHIIALQKAKLEQQNRLIEELKYKNIIEVSRQSLDGMKEDLRKTYYDIDKHLKPKIKCLTNELKIRGIEDTSLVLHCLKVPQFLQRMEARAREREEKHAIIRERRKQMEEDRIRLKQESELARAEMDKIEKMRRIKELREKRKKEKIENIRKKQYAERFKALNVMADLHYEKMLTVKYGIRPLKLLIEIKRDNIEKAKAHYQFQMKKNIFLHWMWHTEDTWYERYFKADDFYRKKVLKTTFNRLKKNHNEYLLKMQVAKDYYDLYVAKLVFKSFQQGLIILKEELNGKWNNAIIYYNSNLLFKTLICWRTLPALNALKREQDARKLKWRQKVLQVVPDYVPPED